MKNEKFIKDILDLNCNNITIKKNDCFINNNFTFIVNHLQRPYIKITKKLYNKLLYILQLNHSDFIYLNNKKYTIGTADGGHALMPYYD